jgi:predicted ferric reductase
MGLRNRAIFWFLVYGFLVFFPLFIAATNRPPGDRATIVEISVAAGFVGLAMLALEFALVSHLRPVALPFGMDALIQFHRELGTMALVFVLAHPVLLIINGLPFSTLNPFSGTPVTQLGSIALIAMLLIVGLSFGRKRLKFKYEYWQLTHGLLSVATFAIAIWHMALVNRYFSIPTMRGLWFLYAILLIGLLLYYRVVLPIQMLRHPWVITENKPEAGHSRTLTLKPEGHKGWSFSGGQFAWLTTMRSPFSIYHHPISMSSGGEMDLTGTIQFTIRDLGDWSGTTVPKLNVGDKVWVDGPYGVFTIDNEQAQGFVLLGGGVGITPMRSIIHTMLQREDYRPVVLFFATNTEDDLTFRDELDAIAARYDNIEVVYVLSSPPADWPGETGFITREVLERHLPSQWQRYMYFICGPEPMMNAMEKVLVEMGVPGDHVQTERFNMV